MVEDIIQHHQPFDFDKFFQNEASKYINIDYNDYQTLFNEEGEVHSFIGESDSDNRIKDALAKTVASDHSGKILGQIKAAMIVIVHSREASKPLTMDEVQAVTEFVFNLPNECDVVWGVSHDPDLGDSVRVMLLVRI